MSVEYIFSIAGVCTVAHIYNIYIIYIYVCVCDFSLYIYRERESRDMYRAHTRTCILYIFMCVCAHVQRADHYTHTHMESKAKHMNETFRHGHLKGPCWQRPARRMRFPKSWGYLPNIIQISQIIQVRNDHERIERYWNLWWRLGIPHLRSHYYWINILFIFYSILFYGFVGFSTRHDPVCHWESFAPTLVMACPLESWRASSCGMLWPLGPTRWLTAGPMAELNQRKN